jgi:hypothetical protein
MTPLPLKQVTRTGLGVQALEATAAGAGASDRWRFVLAAVLSVLFVLGGRLLIACVTGLPLVPPYLHSFDSVNFALALEQFDPTRNQPQPPGYPFFIAEAHALAAFFRTPERTFAAIEILISGLSVAMLYLLARRMLGARAGFISAALLAVNPVFWYAALGSPLRPHLALVSTTVAYFCWRARDGEPKYFYAASAALGLGSGFRPELAAILFPLWAWTAWHYRDRAQRVLIGFGILAAGVATWILALIVFSGGPQHMLQAFSNYGVTQSQESSMLLDPAAGSWRRWAARAFLWNGLGALPWLWTLPFGRRKCRLTGAPPFAFAALWFVPGIIFHLLVHIGEADHALATIPVLCIAGGYCVAAAEESLKSSPRFSWATSKAVVPLWVAVLGNLLLFFGQFPVPHRAPSAEFRGLQSLSDSIIIGTYEASYARTRWIDQMAERAFKRIDELSRQSNRPIIIIWARDGEPVWRKIAYYLPKQPVYALDEKGDPASPTGMAQLWLRDKRLETHSGAAPIQIAVPRGARVLWLISPAAVEGLARVVAVHEADPLYYSDLPDTPATFRWGSFEFATK